MQQEHRLTPRAHARDACRGQHGHDHVPVPGCRHTRGNMSGTCSWLHIRDTASMGNTTAISLKRVPIDRHALRTWQAATNTGINVFREHAPFSVPGFCLCWESQALIALSHCIFYIAFKLFSGFTFLWLSYTPKPHLSVVSPFCVSTQ